MSDRGPRRRRRWWTPLAVSAAAAAFAWWLSRPPPPLEVAVVAAPRGEVEELVVSTTQGVVRARRSAQVRASQPGPVREVAAREGERVRAGQLLLRHDDRVLAAQEAVAAAQAEAAERLLEQAEASQRAGVMPPAERDRVRDQAAVARRQLEAVRAQREQARVRAPFDALVARTFVEAGDSPVIGQPLVDLIDDGELRVEARIDETDLPRVRVGQRVRVTLEAWPDDPIPAEVARIAPVVTQEPPLSRTVAVDVRLLGRGGAGPEPRPGMSADIEVVVGRGEGVVVPSVAVSERGGRRSVWVLEDGRLRRRAIEVAASNWERTAVSRGIEPGAKVVTSIDTERFQDGRVAVGKEEPAPLAPRPGAAASPGGGGASDGTDPRAALGAAAEAR